MVTERPVVYICGPFAAPDQGAVAENIKRAEILGRIAVNRGYAPIVVHSNVEELFGSDRDPALRAVGLECNLAVTRAVAESGGFLWVITRDDGTLSEGCSAEAIEFTTRLMAHTSGFCKEDIEEHLDTHMVMMTWAGWMEGNDG